MPILQKNYFLNKVSNLNCHLQKLEKEEPTRFKTRRLKDIIIRTEKNEVKNRKAIESQ